MAYVELTFLNLAKKYKLPKGWIIWEGKAYKVNVQKGED